VFELDISGTSDLRHPKGSVSANPFELMKILPEQRHRDVGSDADDQFLHA
jgi:hypothetical protein